MTLTLTHEQEIELAKRTRRGDKAARDEFITANIALVVHIAKRYVGRGVDLEDLIQEGTFGLMTAVERFNHHKGLKFCTYATYWIHQTIGRAIENQARLIRLPVHIIAQITELARAIKALTRELKRDPDLNEIADRTGFDADKITSLLKAHRSPAYLEDMLSAANTASKASDNPSTGKGEIPALSGATGAIGSEESIVEKLTSQELNEKVNQALSKLTRREEQVIRWRYGIGDGCGPCEEKTRQAMSQYFKVTGERIRQIEAKALSKLKPLLEAVLEVSSGGFADKACVAEASAVEACAHKARTTEAYAHKARAHKARGTEACADGGSEVSSGRCASGNCAEGGRVNRSCAKGAYAKGGRIA